MRGFSIDQFEKRTLKAQQLMQNHELDALLLTTETNVRYFTGFLTRFWESPTRPWYLIIPSKGKPIAVIPSIGEALMSKTWLEDIRTWPSPDLEDDGISLMVDFTITNTAPTAVLSSPEVLIKGAHVTFSAMDSTDIDLSKLLGNITALVYTLPNNGPLPASSTPIINSFISFI